LAWEWIFFSYLSWKKAPSVSFLPAEYPLTSRDLHTVSVFVIKHLFLTEKLVLKYSINEWHDTFNVTTP